MEVVAVVVLSVEDIFAFLCDKTVMNININKIADRPLCCITWYFSKIVCANSLVQNKQKTNNFYLGLFISK